MLYVKAIDPSSILYNKYVQGQQCSASAIQRNSIITQDKILCRSAARPGSTPLTREPPCICCRTAKRTFSISEDVYVNSAFCQERFRQ